MRNSIFVYPKPSEYELRPPSPAKNPIPQTQTRNSADQVKVKRSTIAWARDIPSALRPRALVIKHPRIANTLAEAWNNPIHFGRLLDDLMIDDRKDRQGFTLEVVQDLANLRIHFDKMNAQVKKEDKWNTKG
jgi:HD-like signal output (HDOD) protein